MLFHKCPEMHIWPNISATITQREKKLILKSGGNMSFNQMGSYYFYQLQYITMNLLWQITYLLQRLPTLLEYISR